MPIGFGEPAPWFVARSPTRADFHFSSVGGRYVLLAFLSGPSPERDAALRLVHAHRGSLLDDYNFAAFGVLNDAASMARARDISGLHWFFDPAGEIARLYDAVDAAGAVVPRWVLIDPALRVMAIEPLAEGERLFAMMRGLGKPDDHAGTALHAPVLITPRIFEPSLCRRLIEFYDSQGGEVSGVMREVDGMTVPVVDGFKKRRDAKILDEALKSALRARLVRRLLPQIERVFQFKATRLERYIVACYDAEEGGYFRPHRDNTTAATTHRQFAVSINLNAEEFEGGDLRFPEFGQRTYRPPTGGAVVFSCSLLHEATPVTKGRRYAFLPFLHDESREQVREENAKYLKLEPAEAE